MKKGIAITLILSLLLSFTACSPSFSEPSAYENLPNSYNAGTDYPMNFWATMFHAIVPAEGGYYIVSNQILMFFDRETATSTPVCNRPECSHRDDRCLAYFSRGTSGFMQSYENTLYLEAIEYDQNGYASYWLYRVNTADCTRSKICQLPYGDMYSYNYWMHRGYLYMSKLEIEPDSDQRYFVVERVALHELAEKSLTPERIFEAPTQGYTPPYIFGNTIYTVRNLPNSIGLYSMYTTAVDVQTLETKDLKMPDMPEGSYMLFQNAYEDQIIATYVDAQAHIRGECPTIYYIYDPETDTYEPFTTLPDRGEGFYDYYSYDGENHQAFYYGGNRLSHPEVQEFRVLDENFETQKRIETNYDIICFMAGDADFMFFEIFDENQNVVLYAIDKRGEELEIVKVFE